MSTPIVVPATQQEHEVVIRALYGNLEKMLTHPNYLAMKERKEYLEALKLNIAKSLAVLKKGLRWWDVVNWGAYYLSNQLAPVLYREIDELIKTMSARMALPVGFAVGMAGSDFDAFIKDKYDLIKRVNLTLGIENDPFVN